jgi:YD repeat-containing protein
MPPQGARALVREILRGDRGGAPQVAATLDDADGTLELLNEGGQTAEGVRVLTRDPDGAIHAHAIGNLAPGATTRARVEATDRCVWTCTDSRGRTHVWSYDGHHRRLRRALDDGALFDSV